MKPRQTTAERKADAGGDYFPVRNVRFVRTGCTPLDCVLGGGWPLGRISNLVGDHSSGKTMLAIEAASNFYREYPKGKVWYREAEAAFDMDYARDVGVPVDKIDFGDDGPETFWSTIEDIFTDLRKCIAYSQKRGVPGLYIVDSLDALSSRVEIGRDITKGAYALDKQKLLGELFRTLARDIRDAQICVLIVSQVREKIGFVLGEKYSRSGGKSLDFYSSQIVWLTHLKQLTRTIKKVTRPTGILVRAKCKKNKIGSGNFGQPHRDCRFIIRFQYGIDDFVSSLEWLEDHGKLKLADRSAGDLAEYISDYEALPDEERKRCEDKVRGAVIRAWAELECEFTPKRRKYRPTEASAG